eukprot:7675029-Karenia_brevis.AAC.1
MAPAVTLYYTTFLNNGNIVTRALPCAATFQTAQSVSNEQPIITSSTAYSLLTRRPICIQAPIKVQKTASMSSASKPK